MEFSYSLMTILTLEQGPHLVPDQSVVSVEPVNLLIVQQLELDQLGLERHQADGLKAHQLAIVILVLLFSDETFQKLSPFFIFFLT